MFDKIRADCAAVRNLESELAADAPRIRWGYARLRPLLLHLLREHREPHQLALATLTGVVIGVTPFLGFHLVLSVIAAKALRLSRLGVVLASQVSIPPLAPFIAFACVQAGHYLTSGDALRTPEASALTAASLGEVVVRFGLYWLLGVPVVGGLLGGALALAIWVLAAALARRTV